MNTDPECFYDLYALMLEETFDIFRDPDRQKAIARAQEIDSLREMLAIDPAFLYVEREPPPALLKLATLLKRCRPYIFSRPVAQLAMDMVDKAGEKALPHEAFLSIPLWIELEGLTIGSETEQFASFFFYPDFDDSGNVRCDMISPDTQRVKTMIFPRSGGWQYEQQGACESKTCTYAPYTREGEPFRVRSQDTMPGCNCWSAAYPWAQLMRACNYLLKHRREPLAETIYEREEPRPYANPVTRKEKEANSEVVKRNRPNIRTISLSAPVSTTRRASRPHDRSFPEEEITLEKISVEAHWRLLIPGEGLPWKTFQILPIESYQRSTRSGEERPRYRVEE